MAEIFFDKNAPYLFTAYGVFLGGMLVYVASLLRKRKTIAREKAMLDALEQRK
jgi:heme exporter protein D